MQRHCRSSPAQAGIVALHRRRHRTRNSCRRQGMLHWLRRCPSAAPARGKNARCACRCGRTQRPRRVVTYSAGNALRSGAIRSRNARCAVPPSPPPSSFVYIIQTCDHLDGRKLRAVRGGAFLHLRLHGGFVPCVVKR